MISSSAPGIAYMGCGSAKMPQPLSSPSKKDGRDHLMGYPENARNQFYMRDWGLMEVSPVLGEDVEFSAENPFRFAARYVAHDGELNADMADDFAERFGREGFAEVFSGG